MLRTRWVSLMQTRRRTRAAVRRTPELQDWREVRPDPAEPLVATIGAELSAGCPDRAHRLAERGWRSRPDHVQLQDLLIASLDHRGRSARALELCVENATRRLRWLARRRVTARHPRHLGAEQRILFAGFFRSGSSAVLGYLRGAPGTTRWTPTGEMRLLKAPAGIADLVQRCETQGGLSGADLVDFYLHLTGWKVTRHPSGSFHARDVVNRHGAVLFRNRQAFGYLHTCLESFLELVELVTSGKPSAADLECFFRDAVGHALDAAATDTGADVLLINQAVNAWRLPISRFLPPSTFVIVHRDPRDQFVDVVKVQRKPGRIATTAELFADDYRRRRVLADRDVPAIAHRYGHRSVRLSFEDFVLDHDRQSRALSDALALAKPGPRQLAERLAGAVGHHAPRLSRAELATLTGSLPEYLDHRVTARAAEQGWPVASDR